MSDASTDSAERVARRRFLDETADLHGDADDGSDPVTRLAQILHEEAPLLSHAEVRLRAEQLAVELIGLGPVQQLLEDPSVTDVLVNGPGELWVERSGRLHRHLPGLSREQIDRSIERLVGPLGLRADRSCPIVDARLEDGTRVSVVLPPLAVDGPLLSVRRHRRDPVPLDAFGAPPVVALLQELTEQRHNIVVYGATGSGKTTLVNALLSSCASHERIVTIEDVAELSIDGEHVVRLEARPGGAEGVGRTEIRDLVRAALRLRPDRIVVGEVRGAEALDMLWALATGHRGGLSTCHADSAAGALRRLETMCLLAGSSAPLSAIRGQMLDAVDVLVGVRRDDTGVRRVVAIHRLDAEGQLVRLVGGAR